MRAILSGSGFLESTDGDTAGPLGIVLEQTPFYAGMPDPLGLLQIFRAKSG